MGSPHLNYRAVTETRHRNDRHVCQSQAAAVGWARRPHGHGEAAAAHALVMGPVPAVEATARLAADDIYGRGLKKAMNYMGIAHSSWHELAQDRDAWRAAISPPDTTLPST